MKTTLLILSVLSLLSCTTITQNYSYTGALIGQNTMIDTIDHSNGDESEAACIIGRGKISDRWRYGMELETDRRVMNESINTINVRVYTTYDIVQVDRVGLFIGVGGGLGYCLDSEYKLLSDDNHDSSGMTGVLDFRTGVHVSLSEWTEIQAQYKLNHISRPFVNDAGSNTDCIEFGIIFKW